LCSQGPTKGRPLQGARRCQLQGALSHAHQAHAVVQPPWTQPTLQQIIIQQGIMTGLPLS
jgi:hypothetical protein